ncbi:MAG: sulfatase [Rikenellaceae bacterium]
MKTQITSSTLFVASLAALTSCNQATEPNQPNIVMLFVDDWGWADMGCRNEIYQSPNIDKLMGESLNFTRAYVSTATSSPSRASLLTGKEALRCGFTRHIYHKQAEEQEFESSATDPGHMLSRGWLPTEEITYAERLKEAGYYNFFVGKWHLGEGQSDEFYPTNQGFDEIYGTCPAGAPKDYSKAPFFSKYNPLPNAKEGDYLTDLLTEGAVDFIENYDKDQPFLLNMWYYSVHGPHKPRKDVYEKYIALGYAEEDAKYAAMVELMDNSIGAIRAALKAKGVADNTIIILTSDQGGSHKNGHLRGGKKGGDTLAEGGSRVPFAIYAPWSNMMGQEYHKPISTIDVFPTFVEIATGKKCVDKQIQGVSLLPTLNGDELADRDIFLHRSYEDQNSAILRGDWKLIKYRSGKLELYNIADDESETTNLVESEPERTKSMLEAVIEWQKEATPDYLLQDVAIGCSAK